MTLVFELLSSSICEVLELSGRGELKRKEGKRMNLMLKSLALLLFFGTATASAYPGQTYTLYPGQTLPLGDGSQVVCQGSSAPLPPPLPPGNDGPACTVKFDPPGNSCRKYVVFDSKNQTMSECLSDLEAVRRHLYDLRQIGTCRSVKTQSCTVKFDPPGISCRKYVIYSSDGKVLSDCLEDMDHGVEPTLRALKQIGICAY
jgi:hypothetical protein